MARVWEDVFTSVTQTDEVEEFTCVAGGKVFLFLCTDECDRNEIEENTMKPHTQQKEYDGSIFIYDIP